MRTRKAKFSDLGIFRPKRGFTLVEILIVVVILGVLAGVVIAKFDNASSDANFANICSNIQTVRSQIQLFRAQHNDLLPGQLVRNGDVTQARFITAMTSDPTYGAYIRRMPLNPYLTAAAATAITCVNNAAAIPAGNEGTGWWFNAATGDFRASDSPSSIGY